MLILDADLVFSYLDERGYANNTKRQYIHKLVVEKALGRVLKGTEEIHHLDEDKGNYTASNLVVCPDRKYHLLLHARTRIIKAGGDPNKDLICSYCQECKSRDSFCKDISTWSGKSYTCNQCGKIRHREYYLKTRVLKDRG